MAGELGAPYPTGNTCYFWLLDSVNRVRNLTTAAFEVPADANWRFTLTFTGGILTGQTTDVSSGAAYTWA
jgi:hypothetical protein